jgi:hypothetical protein
MIKNLRSDKVYPKTYYYHRPNEVQNNETPTKVQVQELNITIWALTK